MFFMHHLNHAQQTLVSYPDANKLIIVDSSMLFSSPPNFSTQSQNCFVTFKFGDTVTKM